MKILKNVYFITIVLLILVAIPASIIKKSFPINLILAPLFCLFFDYLFKKVILKNFSFSYSPLISGIIIASVAPFDLNITVLILACLIAMASKFFIRYKKHIFNPAAFGLFISLLMFNLGDEWWTSISYQIFNYPIILTPILLLASYKAKRILISLSFLISLAFFYYLFFSLNFFDIIFSLPYFLASVMITEPMTSPYDKRAQIFYGILTSSIFFIFQYFGFKLYFLLSLLLANFLYFLYRIRFKSS